MTIDEIVTGLLYLGCIFVVLLVGKLVYDLCHRRFRLQEELIEHQNTALALATVGYYAGLVLAVGGTMSGEQEYWLDDVLDIFLFGALSIVLLNLAGWINDNLILFKFDNVKELVEDRNSGTGFVEAGNHIANGLILFGAMSGYDGDMVTAVAFWGAGQLVLILAAWIYNLITPFDIHAEIERDNVAVGIAFAGALIALGNILRLASEGDFVDWLTNLTNFAGFAVFGLLLLPIVRTLTDRILVPRASISKLLTQDKPNVGAACIEAFAYIAASFLVAWVT